MSLYNSICPTAFVSGGVYTETYTSATNDAAIAALFVSNGMLEDTPTIESSGWAGFIHWFFEFIG